MNIHIYFKQNSKLFSFFFFITLRWWIIFVTYTYHRNIVYKVLRTNIVFSRYFSFFCSQTSYFPVLESSQIYAFKCISIFDLFRFNCLVMLLSFQAFIVNIQFSEINRNILILILMSIMMFQPVFISP